MKTEFEDGSFEGRVLATLEGLRHDVQAARDDLNRIAGRCLVHTGQIASAKAQLLLHTWIIGAIGAAIMTLVGWILFVHH